MAALCCGKEALIALIVLLSVLSNLFVTKQIILFGFHVTPTDALTIGMMLGFNVLQEYYGKSAARKALWISFGGSIVYSFLAQLHLIYLPSLHDTMHIHAYALLHTAPRIIAASLISFVIAQSIDSSLYAWLKRQCNTNYFILRNYVSAIISQLCDTILFSFLALYGIVDSVWSIIGISFLIKCIVILCGTPCIWFLKKWTRKYDYDSVQV